MTQDVVVVNPNIKMSDLGKVLDSKGISCVPVTENKKVLGIISARDYIIWLENGGKDCIVAEKMSKNVKTILEFLPLSEALKIFDKFRHSSFPVIDEDSKIVGILSKNDIYKCLLKKLESEYVSEEIQHYTGSNNLKDIISDEAILKLYYQIKGKDLKHAGECASALKKTLKRLGFHPEVVRRVSIATYETEMNMIIYTDEGQISVEVDQDKIKVLADDKGPGIEDIEKAMHPGYSNAPDWVRELGFGAGMGLENIRRCSDKMTLESTVGKGTQLELIFNLNNKEPI